MKPLLPFLLDLLPLLVFVIIDSIGRVRYALIGAIAAAILELLYSYFSLGFIDKFSIVFAAAILVFAALSLYFNNPMFFRLKPAIIGGITASVIIASTLSNKPALLYIADHYSNLIPGSMQGTLEKKHVREQLRITNGYLGLGLILHSIFTVWVAMRCGRWAWFGVSVPGLYLTILLSVLISL